MNWKLQRKRDNFETCSKLFLFSSNKKGLSLLNSLCVNYEISLRSSIKMTTEQQEIGSNI